MRILILAVVALFSHNAFAADPAFVCAGELSHKLVQAKASLDRNVVFDTVGGYIKETLGRLGHYELSIAGSADGSAEIYLQKMEDGFPKLMSSLKVAAADRRISLPYSNADIEFNLRCVRVAH